MRLPNLFQSKFLYQSRDVLKTGTHIGRPRFKFRVHHLI
jgi:hypothetical protein